MPIFIRAATPDDAEGIVAVFNPIIESGRFTVFDAPFTVDAERRHLSGLPPRAIFHVAVREDDARIVGFQSLEPFATYTRAFDHVGVVGTYVDLTCVRQGIGRQLFEATFQAARQKAYEKIFTYIRADNAAARAAYAAEGFRVVGTAFRQAKIRGQYVDEVMVERFL